MTRPGLVLPLIRFRGRHADAECSDLKEAKGTTMPTSQGGGKRVNGFLPLNNVNVHHTTVWTQLAHLVTRPGSQGPFANA